MKNSNKAEVLSNYLQFLSDIIEHKLSKSEVESKFLTFSEENDITLIETILHNKIQLLSSKKANKPVLTAPSRTYDREDYYSGGGWHDERDR